MKKRQDISFSSIAGFLTLFFFGWAIAYLIIALLFMNVFDVISNHEAALTSGIFWLVLLALRTRAYKKPAPRVDPGIEHLRLLREEIDRQIEETRKKREERKNSL
ncbi:MAG: hypothetical protein HZC02_04320 [Candidatus Levybacteria bacterium]|nr:hypothetical protein [Candidatus Levybacteria bacterium]